MTDESAYLKHILDSIDRIERCTVEGEAAFHADEGTQDAVIRNLEVIGEAVHNLPEELKAKHPEVHWSRIAGMLDKLTHRYLGDKPDVVWESVQQLSPAFKLQVVDLLDRLSTESD